MTAHDEINATAGTKVASIYELAEHILLDLDLPTLIVATQVCKVWREIVTCSKPIRRYLVEEAFVDELTKKLWSPANLRLPWAMKASLANGWLFIYKLDEAEVLMFAMENDNSTMKMLDERVLLVHESGMKYGWKAWWRQRVPFVDSRLLWVTHPFLTGDSQPGYSSARSHESKVRFCLSPPSYTEATATDIQDGSPTDVQEHTLRSSTPLTGTEPDIKLRRASLRSEDLRARWREGRVLLCVN